MLENGNHEVQEEIFKFMHQRILFRHLANYCYIVISIHGLIVILAVEFPNKKWTTNLP